MPAKKDDPMKATHFIANHLIGPFAKGQTVTAEELNKSFGKDKDATPEEHDAHRAASLKRLLDLGAVVPTEAPEEPKEEAAPESALEPKKPDPPKSEPHRPEPPKK